jgi:hypothetical protein
LVRVVVVGIEALGIVVADIGFSLVRVVGFVIEAMARRVVGDMGFSWVGVLGWGAGVGGRGGGEAGRGGHRERRPP